MTANTAKEKVADPAASYAVAHRELSRKAETLGKKLAEMDASIDYLVVGNHQGPGKIATQNKATKLNEAGAPGLAWKL